MYRLKGGFSLIDILVCTPGRLVDHLKFTTNFTLQHLRFLVVDEVDRLLLQSNHEWLPLVKRSLVHKEDPNDICSEENGYFYSLMEEFQCLMLLLGA